MGGVCADADVILKRDPVIVRSLALGSEVIVLKSKSRKLGGKESDQYALLGLGGNRSGMGKSQTLESPLNPPPFGKLILHHTVSG